MTHACNIIIYYSKSLSDSEYLLVFSTLRVKHNVCVSKPSVREMKMFARVQHRYIGEGSRYLLGKQQHKFKGRPVSF